MIEEIVLNHLAGSLHTVPVSMETPPEPPTEFVVIEKTGSSGENGITTATVAVQSNASTLYNASALNERVKIGMKTLAEITNIFRCEVDTDYNFTDTSTKRYRYQAVFTIVYREDY